MLNETLKKRLVKNRAMTSITLRIPVDVVETLKEIAPRKGYSGYQTLLKAYLSEGLRRDEERNEPIAPSAIQRSVLLTEGFQKLAAKKTIRQIADSQILETA